MADVITIVVEGVIPQYSMLQQFGRSYCQVADGIATSCFYMYWLYIYIYIYIYIEQHFLQTCGSHVVTGKSLSSTPNIGSVIEKSIDYIIEPE